MTRNYSNLKSTFNSTVRILGRLPESNNHQKNERITMTKPLEGKTLSRSKYPTQTSQRQKVKAGSRTEQTLLLTFRS